MNRGVTERGAFLHGGIAAAKCYRCDRCFDLIDMSRTIDLWRVRESTKTTFSQLAETADVADEKHSRCLEATIHISTVLYVTNNVRPFRRDYDGRPSQLGELYKISSQTSPGVPALTASLSGTPQPLARATGKIVFRQKGTML